MKLNDKAHVKPHIIEGLIVDVEYVKEKDAKRYLLEYKDAAGEQHTRWFDEGELIPGFHNEEPAKDETVS